VNLYQQLTLYVQTLNAIDSSELGHSLRQLLGDTSLMVTVAVVFFSAMCFVYESKSTTLVVVVVVAVVAVVVAELVVVMVVVVIVNVVMIGAW
jgi:hypothetical protein